MFYSDRKPETLFLQPLREWVLEVLFSDAPSLPSPLPPLPSSPPTPLAPGHSQPSRRAHRPRRDLPPG
jgi:hypothetical protein